jgi:hypothetical protein
MDLRQLVGKNVRLCREVGDSQEVLAFRAGLRRTYVGGVERGQDLDIADLGCDIRPRSGAPGREPGTR